MTEDTTTSRPPALPQDVLAVRRAKARLERARAASLIPHDEAPLASGDMKLIARADALLTKAAVAKSNGDLRGAHVHRTEAKRILMDCEDSLRARTDSRWAERILAEIREIEVAQGGEVEVRSFHLMRAGRPEEGKPLQLSSRDGLYTLHKSGKISAALLAGGLAYREIYEKTDPERSLRPPPIDPADIRVGRGGEGWAEKRAQLWDDRQAIETLVRVDQINGRGLTGLWEVAGKGRCVAHYSSGAWARDANTTALVRALGVVASYFGLR